MAVSRGKDFEQKIKEACLKHDFISIDRFPDPAAGYAGIRNICDFGIYAYPFQYYFECKAFSGNTLNFKADITQDQWNGLTEKSHIRGVMAGIAVWFIDHDITAYVPIQELNHIRNAGAKSLNVKDVTESRVWHFIIPGVKKRIFFDYDMQAFFDAANKEVFNYWLKRLTNEVRTMSNG